VKAIQWRDAAQLHSLVRSRRERLGHVRSWLAGSASAGSLKRLHRATFVGLTRLHNLWHLSSAMSCASPRPTPRLSRPESGPGLDDPQVRSHRAAARFLPQNAV